MVVPKLTHPDEYELVGRPSTDSRDSFDLDEADFESYDIPDTSRSFLTSLFSRLPFARGRNRRRQPRSLQDAARNIRRQRFCRRRTPFRLVGFVLGVCTVVVFTLVGFTSLFYPSYTSPPAHYDSLRQAALSSKDPGRGNPRGEKVFIAASIYDRDGSLASGRWAEGVLELIHLLGPDNVYLSIYENDTGGEAASALKALEQKTPCNNSLVYDPHLALDDVQHITLPNGSSRVKRIAYLAEARNRALTPLDRSSGVQFDKLLFMNDVYFDPVDVLQLLFSTNTDERGVAQYRAACSIDFINPLKFYDTFATRDLEGYGMGLPIYPWFSGAGNAESRADVQHQKDAVRVRSCWGGMVAFDASLFQQPRATNTSTAATESPEPARFRAEPDPFWDASECCLIHADIQIPPHENEGSTSTGVYMNPFVRVAYDPNTLSWLGTTRRFERIYTIPQILINRLVGLPWFNSRREEQVGQTVEDKHWVAKSDGGGSYEPYERKAGTGGFCGRRGLQVMVPKPKKGEKNWEMIPIPYP